MFLLRSIKMTFETHGLIKKKKFFWNLIIWSLKDKKRWKWNENDPVLFPFKKSCIWKMNRMTCEYMQLTLLEAEIQLAYLRIWVTLLDKSKQPKPGQALKTKRTLFFCPPRQWLYKLHFFPLCDRESNYPLHIKRGWGLFQVHGCKAVEKHTVS